MSRATLISRRQQAGAAVQSGKANHDLLSGLYSRKLNNKTAHQAIELAFDHHNVGNTSARVLESTLAVMWPVLY